MVDLNSQISRTYLETLTEENHRTAKSAGNANLILPDASVHYSPQPRIIYSLYTGLLSAPVRASVNKPSIFIMHVYIKKKLHLILLKIKTAYIDAESQNL